MKNDKRINKIIVAFLFMIMLFIFFANTTTIFATSGINPTTPANQTFSRAVKIIIGIFEVVAVGVGIVMLMALAIRYMSSAPSDKAEIKKHAVVYIVGAVMAFGATGIVELIKSFTEEALK